MNPSDTTSHINDICTLIAPMADAARDIARSLYRTPDLAVADKQDDSPVTEADKRIEAQWREMIAQRFPQHNIRGEEFGNNDGDSNVTWMLDPIDGTRQFVYGMPLFGSLIGVMLDDKPVVGCIEVPMMAERWLGIAGQGTTLNGLAASTSGTKALAKARLMATAPAIFTGPHREQFARLSTLCKDVRFGTDCYASGLLASGHCDIIAEASLKPEDIIALIPVLENAGAVVTNWQGKPICLNGDGTFLAAATPALHAVALAALSP